MPSKKKAVKKTAPKKVAKKLIKPRKVKSKVQFVSFTFGATIPTQSYGNIQPSITVKAPSYEEAVEFAIPKIEALYSHYSDVKPMFLGNVTVQEKKVKVPAAANSPLNPTGNTGPTPTTSSPLNPTGNTGPTPVNDDGVITGETVNHSEAFKKAEKAISVAMSQDAVNLISDQIKKSVKIPEGEKPSLFVLILKKQKEFEVK